MKNIVRLLIIVGIIFLWSSAADSYHSKVYETVHITAYTSSVAETDSTPFHTSTGQRVRSGIVAFSPDMVRRYGYKAKVSIVRYLPSRGCNSKALTYSSFIVEDTTNPRFTKRMDIWFQNRSAALSYGKCVAVISIQRK
jgi:3D (Asp-Asp-Asp) domain-containing protein